MVSKMYLGEIVRRVLVNMIEKRLLFQVYFTSMEIRKTPVYSKNMFYDFQGKNCYGLHMENTFSTDFIFKIEADPVGDYRQCKKVGQPSV